MCEYERRISERPRRPSEGELLHSAICCAYVNTVSRVEGKYAADENPPPLMDPASMEKFQFYPPALLKELTGIKFPHLASRSRSPATHDHAESKSYSPAESEERDSYEEEKGSPVSDLVIETGSLPVAPPVPPTLAPEL